MRPEFTAFCVKVEDLDDSAEGGIAIWLADGEPLEEDYLTLQRVFGPDEQSIRLGLHRVYSERNDQGFSGYGGIESALLFRDRLNLRFNQKGSRFMGGISEMKVFFDLDVVTFRRLRIGLAVCFEGSECFRDEAEITDDEAMPH